MAEAALIAAGTLLDASVAARLVRYAGSDVESTQLALRTTAGDGIPGLLLVAAMTVTSLDALRRRLDPTAWKRLHTTGLWVVWSIFFLCLIDSVGRKATDHPVLMYHLFIAVLLLGLGLRVSAARRRRLVAA